MQKSRILKYNFMEIRNIRHTGIVTDDLKASLYFYKNLLGFRIKKRMIESGLVTDKISGLKNVRVETIKLYKKNIKQLIELLYYHSHKRSNNHKNHKIPNWYFAYIFYCKKHQKNVRKTATKKN